MFSKLKLFPDNRLITRNPLTGLAILLFTVQFVHGQADQGAITGTVTDLGSRRSQREGYSHFFGNWSDTEQRK